MKIWWLSTLLFSQLSSTTSMDMLLKKRLKHQLSNWNSNLLNSDQGQVATKRSGGGQFGLPNLFAFRPVSEGEAGEEKCDDAFQLFFSSSFDRMKPKPQQKVVVMKGNASREEQWDFFFNTGKEGSRGYHGCLQTNETTGETDGPCSEFLSGRECHFYPEFAVSVQFYPACCDSEFCKCQCIRECTTREQIVRLLEQNVVNHEYDACTSDVSSVEQGEAWKEERCQDIRHSKLKRTSQDPDLNGECHEVKCVREGACVRDVCKFCFKWHCLNHTVSSDPNSQEEGEKLISPKDLETTDTTSSSVSSSGATTQSSTRTSDQYRSLTRTSLWTEDETNEELVKSPALIEDDLKIELFRQLVSKGFLQFGAKSGQKALKPANDKDLKTIQRQFRVFSIQ